MRKTLLFIHGTGVRGAAYAAAAGLIVRQMKQYGLETVRFARCLWGEEFGAKLSLEGKSIPTYSETRSPDQDVEDTSPALWDLLLQDPTFELSVLANLRPEDVTTESAAETLLSNFDSLGSNKEFHSALDDMGLDHLIDPMRIKPQVREVVNRIARSDGYQRCALPPIAGQARHRDALARAIVAGIQKLALDENTPLLDAPNRDELVMRIGYLLTADKGGVMAATLTPLKGLATHLATWQGRRKRASLADASFPAAGDILRYQVRGKELRDYLCECIKAYADDEVYILAHSLGGVASVETLIENALPNVRRLITFGSQASFFYEVDALKTLPVGEHLPSNFPAWSNFYDLNDPLSYVCGQVFPKRVVDYRIESGESFPASHSAYLHSKPFWQQLAALINHV